MSKKNEAKLGSGFSLVAVTLLFVLMLGCGGCLSRPGPSSDAEYVAGYFQYFDTSQVGKVDYLHSGEIGGIYTIARVQFKGPVKLRDILVEGRAKAGKIILGKYDPAKMTEEDAQAFKQQWMFFTRPKMPSWLDFPFDRQLRTIREASEGSTRDALPRIEQIWYIDDERNVVYFRGSWG